MYQPNFADQLIALAETARYWTPDSVAVSSTVCCTSEAREATTAPLSRMP